MTTAQSGRFSPDYDVHPGMLLEQELEHYGLSQAEFARRIARTPKLVSDIISGKNPVEPETAIQFERVLGVGADVWLGLEAQYRLAQARAAEEKALKSAELWLAAFPVKDLTSWDVIRKSGSVQEKARDLLSFFGVASPEAFQKRYAHATVHYRGSQRMQASEEALRTWLRFGEIQALREAPIRYDKAKFRNMLKQIRALTKEPIQEFRPKMTELCKEAGVIFVLIPPLPKTCLSGAAFWTKGTTPVIQQSLRHKTNDHFWFTFFHEAGHIFLHNPKAIYADDENGKGNNIEKEANDFATEMLVGLERFREFKSRRPRSAPEILDFSRSVDIHPGIVVGMLQHHGVLEWSQLNSLKSKFEWKK